MSSFRIDRQYVSFQTAETQPVYAQTATPSYGAAPEMPETADLTEIYNEIYERLAREHAEQAEYMLSKAADDARETIEHARQEAAQLLNAARQEADCIRRESERALESAAVERKCVDEQTLVGLETELRSSYDKLVDNLQTEVVSLVMEIVRKVIGVKLSQSDEVFMSLVTDALERLKQTGSVVIRMSPEDYAHYFGHEQASHIVESGDIKADVVEDPALTPGDLVVESEGEIIDLGINRQLGQIEKALSN